MTAAPNMQAVVLHRTQVNTTLPACKLSCRVLVAAVPNVMYLVTMVIGTFGARRIIAIDGIMSIVSA